jgi:hypothetical protein
MSKRRWATISHLQQKEWFVAETAEFLELLTAQADGR